jgi:hypothetical protein
MYPKLCPLWLRKCHTYNANLPVKHAGGARAIS